MTEYLSLILALMAAGLLTGFLAGLLGVGGGGIMVPLLYFVFGRLGAAHDYLMHMAIATSFATMVPTALTATIGHYRRDGVDLGVIRLWWPWLVGGAVIGTVLAGHLKSRELSLLFATLVFLMGCKMIFVTRNPVIGLRPPGGIKGGIAPVIVGFFSSLMGIGGASMSVPAMTLYSVPMIRAVGTASLIGLVVAFPAMLGYVAGGWTVPGLLPYSLGFVNVLSVVILAPLAAFAAPFGVRVAHAISRRKLTVIFGVFLIVVALLLWSGR
ncbi:sulfite exporter TauE/SafE family protein [Govanella unica]|uniref:Probable membrane transporter protein n=1 Tax=Govanella unica TaxID=2975056 RepID=A0A9X3Z6T8_9PROT|nr:sulfite exporter TauE/SafE family protein [Govania unica]MDA5193471.1 sulfite exporter TauE/SafE family protein [Govania unica]